MKIGILTFHKAFNYGAFIQSYSLLTKLKECFPDFDIEIIDYMPKKVLDFYRKGLWGNFFDKSGIDSGSYPKLLIKRFVKNILSAKQYHEEKKFELIRNKSIQNSWKTLKVSADSLVTDSINEFNQFIIRQDYDYIIIGSDAIWNDYQVMSPNPYYLHDICKPKKFSYAASSYGMDFNKKSKSELAYIKEALDRYECIGVRDDATYNYMKICKVKPNVVHTCDPAIFLDLNKININMDLLRRKMIKGGVDFKRPLIGLMCDDWLAKWVKRYYGSTHQLVAIYKYNHYADVYLPNLSPYEWAKVFCLFDTVFTHYFHGSLLSLKNGTPTFAVEKKTVYANSHTTKILDVFKRLDIKDYHYFAGDKNIWRKIQKQFRNINRNNFKLNISNKIKVEEESCMNIFSILYEMRKN